MKSRVFAFFIFISFGIFIFGFENIAYAAEDTLRSLLKTGSLLGAILGIIGISLAGFIAGKDFDSYTGWERYTHGVGQFFNRKPFQKDKPTYEKTPDSRRADWVETLEGRLEMIKELISPPDGSEPKWAPPMGIEALPEPLKSYFQEDQEKYGFTLKLFQLMEKQRADWPKYATRYAIIDAWSNAMGSLFETPEGEMFHEGLYPPDPEGPPEEWDFRNIRRDTPLTFKGPDQASELIKKVTHTFGATLVGITKLNPHWCFQGNLRGVGLGNYEVPKHWEYAIVFATPHEWDQLYVNPTYGSSYDGYSRERIIGGRLEAFIHELGYPARTHIPPGSYDMVMPPVAIDAGLGEQGRHGMLITPELGCNARLGCVTTNIPMTVDKPINIGVKDFCKKCKICAETCPSGAITHKAEPDIEFGYKRWKIKCELCAHTWAGVATSKFSRGCRICLAVCPYSRKNNWLHSLSRQIDPRDPTGMVSTMLLWMQKKFFKYPVAKDFMPPPEGKNATYHEPPDWLKTEEWFDVKKDW